MSHLSVSCSQSTRASASASVLPMNVQGMISFKTDWLELLAVQGTLKSLLQHHSSKASILQCSAFFMVQYRIRSLKKIKTAYQKKKKRKRNGSWRSPRLWQDGSSPKCKAGLHHGELSTYLGTWECTHSGCNASPIKDLDKPLVDFRGEGQAWHWFGPVMDGKGRVLGWGDVSSEVGEGGQVAASLGG